ncbi:MAG TPA: PBP1A family penicillin-binding protein [Terriglobales bacterium]|nr:PBP1A family penicillin-binding protein [Terriglobales bacterium]
MVRAAVAAFIIVSTLLLGVFAFYYVRFQKLIDQRMSGPVFNNSSKIYAKPRTLRPGYRITREEVAAQLRRAGYTEAGEKGESKLGTYRLTGNGIEIMPGPESFHSQESAFVRFNDTAVDRISAQGKGQTLGSYELEPMLVTGLFDSQARSKRRLITYDDIPKDLVNAVLAIEDRRFFQHGGINYRRFLQAALRNMEAGRKSEGGSTLTMQIARGFFLTPEKTYTRKVAEMMISIELEQRFSKRQIFEFYANQIYMGQRGSFTIHGLGEASQAYFGKDIKNLSLPEAALLAGMIQRPNYLSPYRNKEAALARRNLVLHSMVETGSISQEQADKAKATGMELTAPNVEASDAPYFVDLLKDTMLQRYSEDQLNEDGLRIYSTLDPELQTAAAEAVAAGLKEIDDLVYRQRRKVVVVGKGKNAKKESIVRAGPEPQVALVALDPNTGEILALVGGRNYGQSQLNHAIAKRPTGSIFKPFVFAAAVNTAITGQQPVFTAASLVDNTPTAFYYEDKVYEPRNYQEKYNEVVNARFALAHSLNNATVRIAEQVGYDKVVELARASGIKDIKATPALALGAYDATPIEMAGAYTIFANQGVRATPILVSSIRDSKGEVIEDFNVQKKPVLDPRVAYVMTSMMEAVINNGTAAGVRARGFAAPAAGKTGTSHDAWFAGYTKDLLCIVWVGYDDYTDLKLEGAKTAAPIWTEFMKRAIKLPSYANPQPFPKPDGVISLTLDKVTNRIATSTCPDDYVAAFIEGTEPHETCDQAAASQQGFFSKIFGNAPKPLPPGSVSNSNQQLYGQSSQPAENTANQEQEKKKKGFWGRLFGGSDDEEKKKEELKKKEERLKTATPASTPPKSP